MRTESGRQAQKRTSKRSKSQDAVALLREDHKNVLDLFKQFQKLTEQDGGEADKAELARQICEELKVHTTIEEEIFYPAVRAAIDEALLMDEATVEHESAKTLIGEIEDMQPGDELYDAKITVLGEYIKHHVDEEQKEMFPKAKKAKVDLAALGEQLLARKQELSGGSGASDLQ
jgi:hemerythrin-like domain-containing protein